MFLVKQPIFLILTQPSSDGYYAVSAAQVFIKEWGAKILRKIRPSPILWETFEDSAPAVGN
jgi:hypothetical protein